MSEKEFIQKLNSLKIKPDEAWKNRNREILLSQISGGVEAEKKVKILERLDVWSEVFIPFDLLHKLAAKPVLVTGLVIASLLGGGVFSLQAAKNTKPGDSLYIAKIISEKARTAITFDEKEKAKLGVEFAGNRAKEIVRVISEEKDESAKTEKVEKLEENFKKELSGAKDRLEKISSREQKFLFHDENGSEADKNESDGTGITEEKKNGEDNKPADEVFGANLGKDKDGIQVSDPTGTPKTNEPKANPEIKPSDNKATTTVENEKPAEKVDARVKILNDAEEMFENKDYGGAVEKLEEIKNIISENNDTSQNDSATSTDDKVEMSSN
jgi:hypothetical protein